MTVLGDLLWPTFLFTHALQRDILAAQNISLSTVSCTASHLSKQCHSMVTYREAVNWLLFLHCAFHFSPNRNSHLILHLLLLWMEPSPDTASDRSLSASDYSDLKRGEKTVLKDHCTTVERNKDKSKKQQKKKEGGKENGKENLIWLFILAAKS